MTGPIEAAEFERQYRIVLSRFVEELLDEIPAGRLCRIVESVTETASDERDRAWYATAGYRQLVLDLVAALCGEKAGEKEGNR